MKLGFSNVLNVDETDETQHHLQRDSLHGPCWPLFFWCAVLSINSKQLTSQTHHFVASDDLEYVKRMDISSLISSHSQLVSNRTFATSRGASFSTGNAWRKHEFDSHTCCYSCLLTAFLSQIILRIRYSFVFGLMTTTWFDPRDIHPSRLGTY